jgi:short-subunit dehydrogenase
MNQFRRAAASPKSILASAAFALGAGAVLALTGKKSSSMAKKVVVITGGSRGLGLALAEEFGRHGAMIVLAARDRAELERAKGMLLQKGAIEGAKHVLTVPCDLTDKDDAHHLISRTIKSFGRVDVLINNAGVIHVGPVEKQTFAMYESAMNTNFYAMLHTTYAALPDMLRRQEGSIVNIASIGGKSPVPHLAPYTASKFAAVGFSESLHAELRPKGIRVTTVNPALMRTGSYPNAKVVGKQNDEYGWFALSASIPGLAHSVPAAARQIFKAVAAGKAEIEVGFEAYLAARLHGLSPTTTQFLGSLAEQVILPEDSGARKPVEGTNLDAPSVGLWKRWSDKLTRQANQPEA